jgi:hypothetical protein
MPKKTVPPAERFWPKVDKSAGVDGCWLWQGTQEPAGYGQFWWNNTSRKAHRFAWVLTHGEPPAGHSVVQQCGNRLCVNPAHLGLKSPAEKHAELAAGKPERTLSERFWEKVDKQADDGCWLWTGALDGHGYGQIYLDGAKGLAHRVAWELVLGVIPDGMCVCHNCPGGDNPLCVRPAHLFLDTHLGNLQDAARKGRVQSGSLHYRKRNPALITRGVSTGCAKLTDDQVREIRRKRKELGTSQEALGREYGVSQSAIWRIVSGKGWTHLE